MEKFSLIKRGSIYFQGDNDIISLYKNDSSVIMSIETIYEPYEEIENEIKWYKSSKHIEDLIKTIDWLNENGSCYEKDKNDGTYHLLSFAGKDEELEELEEPYVSEKTDPFLEDYWFNLNKMEFFNEDSQSPYNGAIKSYDE